MAKPEEENGKSRQANRIPYEDLQSADNIASWSLPNVSSKARVVFGSSKKNNRRDGPASGEVVEDYKGVTKPKPLTAEQLQKLAEQAKKEGREQGYQEGLAKGNAEGLAQGQKQGTDKAYRETKAQLTVEIERLRSIADALLSPMQEQEKHLEKIIVDMAIHFAKAMIGAEIDKVPAIFLDTINEALATLPAGSKNITVFVNPEDIALVEQHLPQELRNWSLKEQANITQGGCIVQTNESLVDYSVENRFQEYLKHVQEKGNISADNVPPLQDYPIADEALTASESPEDADQKP